MQVFQVYFQDGISMEKIACYSKYTSYVYLFLMSLTIVIGIFSCVLFNENDTSEFKTIWILLIVVCLLVSIYGFIHHRQYLCVENDKFVLKDSFFVLKELDIKECYYIISSLNSYFGVTVMRETWICIYSKNETKRFRYGVSNGQKYLGIQLIYSKENLEFIDKYIERKY